MVDSGASVNLVDSKTHWLLGLKSNREQTEAGRLVSNLSEVFKGIGKLKDFQLRLNIAESVEPVCQKHRRVPF